MSRKNLSATFVISAVKPADFPNDGRPEVALVGRSNVGKSSLINALVRQDIARTSSTPGKTRQVNVYRMSPGGGSHFYLMDLPGYGHTGGGEKAREEFSGLTSLYFESRTGSGGRGHAPSAAPRSALHGVVLAIDARHPGMSSDVDAWHWLASLGVPGALRKSFTDGGIQEGSRQADHRRQDTHHHTERKEVFHDFALFVFLLTKLAVGSPAARRQCRSGYK